MGPHFNWNWLVSRVGNNLRVDHAGFMFTEIYIEALLVDEYLANQVWGLWHEGVITDGLAAWAWGGGGRLSPSNEK